MILKSKCAVVTGGAGGIGGATAEKLLREGCRVALWDISPEALLRAKVDLEAPAGALLAYPCDVADREQVYQVARQTEHDLGGVDILINNAGVMAAGNFLEQSDELWERTIQVNLTAMLYTIRAFLPGMYARNAGHIVNVSSASAFTGVPGLAVYAASKWGVWGLTESLRQESLNLKKGGIRWSTVHPLYIAKGMFAGAGLSGLGGLLFPVLKDHDVVARAIVNGALKRGRRTIKRPRSLRLALLLRGMLPDALFQRLIRLMNVHTSMENWTGNSLDQSGSPKRGNSV